MNDALDTESEGLVYQYRPRMIGSGYAFRLGPHSLEWDLAGSRGSVAYPMIARVRLGYRPSNFGTRRFIAEIWPRNGARVEVASASYKSVVAMEDQAPAYNAFIRELHRRIAEARGNCRFDAGFAAWRWWPMLAVGAVTTAGLVYVAIRALASGDLSATLLIIGFMAVFAWQIGPLITRNRPRFYDPRHIPEDVLPKG
ncbi:MAG: hypothetical protein WD871_05980 [Xanthobacteraceae bacterium]